MRERLFFRERERNGLKVMEDETGRKIKQNEREVMKEEVQYKNFW